VKATKGPDEALCVLKSHAKAHRREWVRALEASLHLDAGRLESAQEKLDHFPVTRQCEENLQIFVMQLRLDEASVAGRDKDYDALSARAFRWFPFDAEFARQRVAFLAPSDPEQAKKVLEVTLQQGNVDRNLMLLDAELYGYDIERAMRVIAEIVPPELVYRALGAAFDVYRPRIDQYSVLLGWAVEAFPQVAAIRRMWVELLVDSGRAQDAIVACEQFAADYPEEVLAVLRLRGLCYANIDPDRAIPALRKVLEARSDPEAYNQLAEAYANTGDEANARQTLEQLFESSPYDGQGLTQLYWLGDSASVLVDRVFGCIEQTAQIPAYLHVLAVQCARETEQTVPMKWYAGAFARLEIAQQGPAVRDELPRLRKCIAQWQKQHPTVPDERVTGPALHVRLWGWPGRTWVPAA
jgi:tetratricopeptide (TPR) repeat protein